MKHLMIDRIMFYENGELSDSECVYLFSDLLKSGMAWSLQGAYGRVAMHMINMGILNDMGDINHDKMSELGIEN